MNVKSLVELLHATIFTTNVYDESQDIKYAFSGDLMSDVLMVLRTAPSEFFEYGALITGNVTMQSVRTAEMLDFPIIILTRDKTPSKQVIAQAEESRIMLIGTRDVMFSVSGKLYEHKIKGFTDIF